MTPAGVGLPRWLYVPALIGLAFVLLPLIAMVSRVEWADLGSLVGSASARDALWLSLRTSGTSTLFCVLLGVPMAVVLARTSFRGQGVMRALVLLPLVIPPVVSGIALLATFGRRGLLGPTFELLGIDIAFSTAAVVMAQTFVSLPFLVISLEGALRTAGQRYEVVAATLGAAPTTVFRRVTLPLVLPGCSGGPSWPSPGPSGSSGRPSRSRGPCRAPRRRCRHRSTSSGSRTRTPPLRCRSCWSWWRSS